MTAPANPDRNAIPAPASAAPAPVNPPTALPPPAPKPLTVEEQMALYEKHLKENDWGHQPC